MYFLQKGGVKLTIDELKKQYKEYIPLTKVLKAKEKHINELKKHLILIPTKQRDEFYYKSKEHFLQLFAEYEKDYKNTAEKLSKLIYYNKFASGISGEILYLRYICGYSIIKICNIVGYEERQIQRYIKQGLQSICNELN